MKTSKVWLLLLRKPKKGKTQLNKLIIDSKRDPLYKRIIAGVLWLSLSLIFVWLSIYILIYCFDFIFGASLYPCSIKWLTFKNNKVVPFVFIFTLVFMIFCAFCSAMILWTYCMRKTHFIRESTIELIGRNGPF